MDAKKEEFDINQIEVIVDGDGREWVCGLGVNDKGYHSAQRCWPADELVPGGSIEIP